MAVQSKPMAETAWRTRSVTSIALGGFVLLFSALTIEHGLALYAGRVDLETAFLAWLTSDAFIFGPESIQHIVPWYKLAAGRMGSHMALGGVALGLGLLQFVPTLRRRYPLLHRASGLAVWIATLASMISAIGFLVFVPMRQGTSGPVFYFELWALDLLTLGLLYQAILAVRARDFRSHMVWMSLVFAALLAAPASRLDWVVFAHLFPHFGQEFINLGASTFVVLQTVFVMTLWLGWVGDRDLPARKQVAVTSWPQWLIVALSILSAMTAIHEAWLVRLGFDLFGSFRETQDVLPSATVFWALAMLPATALAPGAWRRALSGTRPSTLTTVIMAGVAFGALAIGLEHDRGSLVHYGIATVWTAYGILLTTAIVFAHVIRPNSLGRNAWALVAVAMLWLPSELFGLIALGLSFGATFGEALGMALANGGVGLAVMGVATGFGATLRLAPARKVSRTTISEVAV